MAKSARPFLMFQGGKADAALTLYASLFPDAKIEPIERFATGEYGAEGGVKRATFTLLGQSFAVFDSPPVHAFTFTPSFSIFVECENEAELRKIAGALADGGGELMPVGSYGFSTLFAWVNDRFGVSWQLNLQ